MCYEKSIRNLMQFSMNILSDHFDEGLAARLVELQLTHQCDDSMLKAIGQHAKFLKKLDVSFSFNVTIDGVKGFLFKVRTYSLILSVCTKRVLWLERKNNNS